MGIKRRVKKDSAEILLQPMRIQRIVSLDSGIVSR
jgi:hypothetical protein